MESKLCTKCNQILHLSKFSLKYGKPQHCCKECHSKYRKEHYNKNKDKTLKQVKINKDKQVDWFVKIKSKLKCITCGESRHWVLDFHHRDPKTKLFEIGTNFRTLGKQKILDEIAKCDVLCANCHRDYHYQQRLLNRLTDENTCNTSI